MMDVQTLKIEALIGEMTLEEKIGQLQQCGPSLVGAFEVSFEELLDMMFDGRISQEEFGRLMSTAEKDFHEDDLRAGKIGSYNGVGDAQTANRLQKIAVEESRLGIPLLFGYDVIHGFRTVTPIPLAESCAWEPDLWQKTARMSAEEATAAGIHMTFAPMVDVAKDARWGRVSEGAGEDTLLNGDYGAAKVRGFQGRGLVASGRDGSLPEALCGVRSRRSWQGLQSGGHVRTALVGRIFACLQSLRRCRGTCGHAGFQRSERRAVHRERVAVAGCFAGRMGLRRHHSKRCECHR